jgi:parvulin-like peptidyl-prolyl isomerase
MIACRYDPISCARAARAVVYGETAMSRTDAEIALEAMDQADRKRRIIWLTAAFAVLLAAILLRLAEGDRPASADSELTTKSTAVAGAEETALPKVPPPQHDVMALVNGQDINRRQLIDACVKRFGEEVLEAMVNKKLIETHCAKRGVTVTNEEIAAEIDRMAKRFQIGREQWLDLLEKERGVGPQEYARDIVWPTLALRKLADKQMEVTPEEISRAYEQDYGPMVDARLIAVSDEKKAHEIHSQLVANPNDFARLAIEKSEDVNSASVGGMIQPIRKHMGDKNLEAQAFALQPGQISPVIPIGGQFVILKCEKHIEPQRMPLQDVQQRIVERIREEKLRTESNKVFADVQKNATIQNVYNDPNLRETMPDVVALVNGDRITMQELGAECLTRHGEEVLEGEISRLLLEQATAAAQITVSAEDIDAEMQHAAELAGVLDAQGNADLAAWIAAVEEEQGVSKEQYIHDSVWPSAALKKLTAQTVEVTQEDINKGFEANFGERVRCRAIVLDNMRRAQEVWDKARKNTSPDYFGDLAAEYSVEPTSKALRGEVPPLGRHGGQEKLENVAFTLEEGQLSGIVQVADKFIILRCEGRTERIDVDEATVREELHRDIFEKKLRMAMGQKFEEINEKARVDNYLAGTSKSPVKRDANAQSPVRQDTAVRPTAGSVQ